MIADCLCNLQFLDRSCRCGFLNGLIPYFVEYCETKLDPNETKRSNLLEVEEFIRKNLRFLNRFPTLFMQCAANDRGSIAISQRAKEWLLNNPTCSTNIFELISDNALAGTTLLQCIEAPMLQVISFVRISIFIGILIFQKITSVCICNGKFVITTSTCVCLYDLETTKVCIQLNEILKHVNFL